MPAAMPARNGNQFVNGGHSMGSSGTEGSCIADVLQVFPRRDLARQAEVPDEPCAAERDEDQEARIELVRLEPHARRFRESVVVVVPAFPHRDEAAAVQVCGLDAGIADMPTPRTGAVA